MFRPTLAALALIFLSIAACKPKPAQEQAAAPKVVDLIALANSVPSTGPRTGNNYKVFMLVLRQNQSPAAGFRVDMSVKGKGAPITVVTNESGLAQFDNLPFPEAKQPLMGVVHYFNGQKDASREITYPYLDSDAYRLKDTQYIPNMATPDAAAK